MRSYPIETLQPAKVTIPVKTNHVIICASPTLLSNSLLTNELKVSIPADSLIFNLLHSLKKSWEQAPGYENTLFTIALTEQPVKLSHNLSADLIVRLDRMDIKNMYYGDQYYLGWKAFLQVYFNAEWTLRDNANNVVDTYSDRDLVTWQSETYETKVEALLGLPAVNDAWWDMGIVAARNYAHRITPQWKTESRTIYGFNNEKELSEKAYTAMQNSSYARACNIWEEMLIACPKNGRNKRKSDLAYNMAVAFECQNLLEDAIIWAQKSVNESASSDNVVYLHRLKERQRESDVLHKQIIEN